MHGLAYRQILGLKFGRGALSIHPSVLVMSTAVIRPHSRLRPAIAIGNCCVIRGELLTLAHGGKISVGDYCFVGEGTRIWSGKNIAIGNRVLISHHVNIFDNLTHPLSATARHRQFREIFHHGHPVDVDLDEKEVVICDDALICAGAIILRGVTIGRGSIVAAGAVVTKDVPDWTIVAGNPAQRVRELDSKER